MECLRVDHKRREEIWKKKRLTCRESWHFKQQLNKGKQLSENINWAEPARQRHNRRRKIITIVIIKAFFRGTVIVLRNVVRCWAILWGERERELFVCEWIKMMMTAMKAAWGDHERVWGRFAGFHKKKVKNRAFSLALLCAVILLTSSSFSSAIEVWQPQLTLFCVETTKLRKIRKYIFSVLCGVLFSSREIECPDRPTDTTAADHIEWNKRFSLNKNLFISYSNSLPTSSE